MGINFGRIFENSWTLQQTVVVTPKFYEEPYKVTRILKYSPGNRREILGHPYETVKAARIIVPTGVIPCDFIPSDVIRNFLVVFTQNFTKTRKWSPEILKYCPGNRREILDRPYETVKAARIIVFTLCNPSLCNWKFLGRLYETVKAARMIDSALGV